MVATGHIVSIIRPVSVLLAEMTSFLLWGIIVISLPGYIDQLQDVFSLGVCVFKDPGSEKLNHLKLSKY